MNTQNPIDQVEKELKEAGHTWKSYSELLQQNPSNFKRKLSTHFGKLNKWLNHLGLQIVIKKKQEK